MLLRPAARRSLQTPRSGFTLLEILVVVAIIVMLAGVGGYYVMQRYEEAKISTAKMNVEAISNAVEQYKLRNDGNPPTDLATLTQQGPNGEAPFMPADKLKDPWGKQYTYDPAGQHNNGYRPDVSTTAPNGTVIGNWGK